MPISVGQQYHEGDKLAAALKLIGSRFKSCDIIICDSLQRHTLEVNNGLSKEEAYKESIKLGDQWLYRNKDYIYDLSIPFKIIRWDQWLKKESYSDSKVLVDSLFLKNCRYNNAFVMASRKFVDRYKLKQQKYIDYDYLSNKCIEYLKEECAVTPVWIEEKYDFIVYPGKRTDAMMAAYRYQIEPLKTDLLTWVHVNFKRKCAK